MAVEWLVIEAYVRVVLDAFSWKLLNDSMNFLVRKVLFSLNRLRIEPKAVVFMSCILNLMVLLGMEGMLISKFVFICKFIITVYQIINQSQTN